MKRLAFALSGLLLFSACTSTAAAAPSAAVKVTMTDQAIALSQASVAPGKVTFTIANGGSVVHSLVLLKTDTPHDKIPADPANAGKVQETGSVAATGQIPAGGTKEFTRDLAAGSYVLICNEPAHYLVGMHIGLTVK